MHDAKVLHGDLRLENLLVQDSGDVVIIDFDQAKLEAEDGFGEEYEVLRSLLEEFVEEDIVESVETAMVSRVVERDEVAINTGEVIATRSKGEAEAVEVSEAPAQHGSGMGVAADVDATIQDIDLPSGKHKAKATATVDAAPTPKVQKKVKAKNVRGSSTSRKATATVDASPTPKGQKKVKAKKVQESAQAAGTSRNTADDGSDKPRMAGRMVLRPKPPTKERR